MMMRLRKKPEPTHDTPTLYEMGDTVTYHQPGDPLDGMVGTIASIFQPPGYPPRYGLRLFGGMRSGVPGEDLSPHRELDAESVSMFLMSLYGRCDWTATENDDGTITHTFVVKQRRIK